MSRRRGYLTIAELEAELSRGGAQAWRVESLPEALAGDPEAASLLITRLDNANRGIAVRALYEAKIPPAAFRAALGDAWAHDHAHVWNAANTWPRFVAMFRYAEFPLPELPPKVTIWRGGAGASWVDLALGPSWTLNRAVACWFAMRFADSERAPLVLSMTLPRRSLIYYGNDRGEEEVIPARTVTATIDGDAADWQREADVLAAARKAKREAFLATLADPPN